MRAILSLILLALVAGCQTGDSELALKLSAHLHRFDELRKMESGPDRDEGLARLTEDACTNGFSDLAHVVVGQIESDDLRDEIAHQCALLLEKGKTPLEAARIAASFRKQGELRTALK